MVTIRQVLKKYGVKKDTALSTRTHRRYYKTISGIVLKIELTYKKSECVNVEMSLRAKDVVISDDDFIMLSYLRKVGKNCVNDIKYALMLKEEKK